jgi:glycerate 2-kinase
LVRPEEGELIRPLLRLRQDVIRILRAGVEAVGAAHLVEQALSSSTSLGGLGPRPPRVIAAGKSAPYMAAAFARVVPDASCAGLAVGTHCPAPLPPGIEWHRGGHPVPDDLSVAAGVRALEIAGRSDAADQLVVLLSGGASALLAVPAPGLTLEDKRAVTQGLLAAGAEIGALNTVRKHLSRIKGGWLSAAARGPTLTLAISDVVGDDLSVIGSGPTVPDPSRFADALGIIDRFGGRAAYPAAAVAWLVEGSRGRHPETPKPGDPRLARSVARVIGSRRDALEGGRRAAEALGYGVTTIARPVVGEARLAAPSFVLAAAKAARGVPRPACILAGGETTVRVTGHGRGGRNQEFALASAGHLTDLGPAVVLASVGTDGIDGPTDAAGAIVDSSTLARAKAAGLAEPERYLADNDSYAYFRALGDLILTGPTDTNVGDIQVVLINDR